MKNNWSEVDTPFLENEIAFAIYDGFPVSPGHSLIIPRRHISSFFEATSEEQLSFLDLISKVQQLLKNEYSPDSSSRYPVTPCF